MIKGVFFEQTEPLLNAVHPAVRCSRVERRTNACTLPSRRSQSLFLRCRHRTVQLRESGDGRGFLVSSHLRFENVALMGGNSNMNSPCRKPTARFFSNA